jgi:hypothetical protein
MARALARRTLFFEIFFLFSLLANDSGLARSCPKFCDLIVLYARDPGGGDTHIFTNKGTLGKHRMSPLRSPLSRMITCSAPVVPLLTASSSKAKEKKKKRTTRSVTPRA